MVATGTILEKRLIPFQFSFEKLSIYRPIAMEFEILIMNFIKTGTRGKV